MPRALRTPGDQTFRHRDMRRMIKVSEEAKLKKYQIEVVPGGLLKLSVDETGGPTDAPDTNPWDEKPK